MVFRTLAAGYLLGLSSPEAEPGSGGADVPAAGSGSDGGDATNRPRQKQEFSVE